MKEFRVPTFCPHCEQVMKGSKSISTYYDYNCCMECFVEFVEGREERWKSGWRPDKDRMEVFFKKMNSNL